MCPPQFGAAEADRSKKEEKEEEEEMRPVSLASSVPSLPPSEPLSAYLIRRLSLSHSLSRPSCGPHSGGGIGIRTEEEEEEEKPGPPSPAGIRPVLLPPVSDEINLRCTALQRASCTYMKATCVPEHPVRM